MDDWLIWFLSIVVFSFIFSVILSIIKRVKKSNQAQSNAQNSQAIQMAPPSYLQVVTHQRPIGFQPSQHTTINIHPLVLSTPSQNFINSESSRVSLDTNLPHMIQIHHADNLTEDNNPPPPYEDNITHTSPSRF